MPDYKYRFLGTGTTNSQGIATLNKDPDDQTINGYTGVGAGKVDIIASDNEDPTDTEAMLSEPKIITDCRAYDHALSGEGNHNDNMWNNVTNFTRGDSYTEIASTGSGYGRTVTLNDNECLEIDIKMSPARNTNYLMILRDGSTTLSILTQNNCGLVNDKWQHFKISVIDERATIVNETEEITYTVEVQGIDTFELRVMADTSTYFRELQIYPI